MNGGGATTNYDMESQEGRKIPTAAPSIKNSLFWS